MERIPSVDEMYREAYSRTDSSKRASRLNRQAAAIAARRYARPRQESKAERARGIKVFKGFG